MAVRTRKRGKTYSYIFEAGKDNEGKRKVIEKGGFATQKEAYNAGVSAYTDWLHGNIGITSIKITLKDFMANWLEKVVALNVKSNTLQEYKFRFEHYILPKLGDEKVQDITPAVADKFTRELAAQGFSKNTLSAIQTLLCHALDYAVYPAQIISSNPARYIKVSKKAPTNVVQRTIISQEKFSELLIKYPFGSALYIPLLLLYHTGMRISEVCGLSWDDVNFEKGVISLCRQIIPIRNKGSYFSTPKTKSSVREIVMDKFLMNELQRWKNHQLDNEAELGESYVYVYRDKEDKVIQQSRGLKIFAAEKVELVCTHKDGKFVQRNYVIYSLAKENLNSHSFRHTHATVLIENGAMPKGVAGRLGHSNATITQNLYTHNTEKIQGDTLAIFEKTLQTKTQRRQYADE